MSEDNAARGAPDITDAANAANAAGTTENTKPQPPDPEHYNICCVGGCSPCVYDLYWEAVAHYETLLAQWQAKQPQDNL